MRKTLFRLFDGLKTAPARWSRYAEGIDDVVTRWAIWLTAAVFGGACAALCYGIFKAVSPAYPEFIVGYITVNGGSKARDYAMLLGFILGAAAIFVALAVMFRRLSTSFGPAIVENVYGQFIVALLPALAWFATFFLPQPENRILFWISAFAVIATTVGLSLVLGRREIWSGKSADHISSALDGFILLPIISICAVLSVGMIGNRVGIVYGRAWFKVPDSLHWGTLAAALIALTANVILMTRAAGAARVVASMRRFVLLVQFALPGLFLMILPSPVGPVDRHFSYPYEIHAESWIFLGLLTVVTWADLLRLWRKGEKEETSPATAVSVFTLIAILIYCRSPSSGLLGTPSDDYHFGENFLPWWSWIQHGKIPLWDFSPARGFINYQLGFFAAIFTDQSASGLLAAAPYAFSILVLIVFFPLALLIGKWRAFYVLLFAALDEYLGSVDALMAAALCILGFTWTRLSHVQWLLTWLAIGTAALLLAPGQGGLLIIATSPGGLWRLYCAMRDDRSRLLQAAGFVAVLLAILIFASPIGLMIAGAIRYGLGQSAVNSIANGIPWKDSFGTTAGANPWLFELIRFSWIGAGAAAIVLTLCCKEDSQDTRRGRAIFIGSTVAILCLLYVIRAGVRIDLASVSRPGWASIWAMGLLMPILLTVLFSGTRRLTALAITVTCAATLTGQFGAGFNGDPFFHPFAHVSPHARDGATNGPALSMSNLGVVKLDERHLKRLETLKSRLDRLLDPAETYLDMTNRVAQYYYFDRPPPSDAAAYYNMITLAQQKRAVEATAHQHVPVALTSADNLVGELVPSSLRAPLLYRYLLLNFVPITLDGYDYMLRPERLPRAGVDAKNPGEPTESEFKILDRDFLMPDLMWIPYSWGKSADTLAGRMRDVTILDARDSVLTDVEQTSPNVYRVIGTSPAITFNLVPHQLRGRDAGLLRFEYKCLTGKKSSTFTLRWRDEETVGKEQPSLTFEVRNGPIIVPLDSAPRWLLTRTLETLKLEVKDTRGCTSFRIKDPTLAQRREFDEIGEVVERKP